MLEPGGVHTGHVHPHSVLSGTFYVDVPPGASALKLEDPRLPLMMAAPPRSEDAPEAERTFVYVDAKAGDVLMWESFVRHEVPANDGEEGAGEREFQLSLVASSTCIACSTRCRIGAITTPAVTTMTSPQKSA